MPWLQSSYLCLNLSCSTWDVCRNKPCSNNHNLYLMGTCSVWERRKWTIFSTCSRGDGFRILGKITPFSPVSTPTKLMPMETKKQQKWSRKFGSSNSPPSRPHRRSRSSRSLENSWASVSSRPKTLWTRPQLLWRRERNKRERPSPQNSPKMVAWLLSNDSHIHMNNYFIHN